MVVKHGRFLHHRTYVQTYSNPYNAPDDVQKEYAIHGAMLEDDWRLSKAPYSDDTLLIERTTTHERSISYSDALTHRVLKELQSSIYLGRRERPTFRRGDGLIAARAGCRMLSIR